MTRAQTVLRVALKKLQPEAIIPRYQTAGAAGFDLHACLPGGDVITIEPGQTVKVPTGIAVSIGDPSWALHLLSRSGLASKGIVVANGIGLIDSDYQGELIVLLRNRSSVPFQVAHSDRIAQGEFVPVIQAQFVEVDDFAEKSERGTGGFGSTGVRSAQDIMLEAAGGQPDVADLIPDEEGLVVEEEATAGACA